MDRILNSSKRYEVMTSPFTVDRSSCQMSGRRQLTRTYLFMQINCSCGHDIFRHRHALSILMHKNGSGSELLGKGNNVIFFFKFIMRRTCYTSLFMTKGGISPFPTLKILYFISLIEKLGFCIAHSFRYHQRKLKST